MSYTPWRGVEVLGMSGTHSLSSVTAPLLAQLPPGQGRRSTLVFLAYSSTDSEAETTYTAGDSPSSTSNPRSAVDENTSPLRKSTQPPGDGSCRIRCRSHGDLPVRRRSIWGRWRELPEVCPGWRRSRASDRIRCRRSIRRPTSRNSTRTSARSRGR